MALTVSESSKIYRNVFENYMTRLGSIQSRLNSEFNFGLSPDAVNYNDFWSIMTSIDLITQRTYSTEFNKLDSDAQHMCDTLENSYMNILGMVNMLDNYMCNISDTFSRIVDVAWSCGRGSIYHNKTGKLLEDGSSEILKKGVIYYTDIITNTINEISDFINEMDKTKWNNLTYLENVRQKTFVPLLTKINDAIIEVSSEFVKLISVVENARAGLDSWITICFRFIANVSLTFSLSNKSSKIAQKTITVGDATHYSTSIAVSLALSWKEKLNNDRSNYQECINGAIKQGLLAITESSKLDALLEETWDNYIPVV